MLRGNAFREEGYWFGAEQNFTIHSSICRVINVVCRGAGGVRLREWHNCADASPCVNSYRDADRDRKSYLATHRYGHLDERAYRHAHTGPTVADRYAYVYADRYTGAATHAHTQAESPHAHTGRPGWRFNYESNSHPV